MNKEKTPTTSGDEELVKKFNDFCHQHDGKIYPPLKRLFVEMLDTKNQQITAAKTEEREKIRVHIEREVIDPLVDVSKPKFDTSEAINVLRETLTQ